MNKRPRLLLLLLVAAGFVLPGRALSGAEGFTSREGCREGYLDLTGSRQGQAVAFVDVDGDGTDDKLVGAPFAAVSSRTGAVLVYRGVAAG